MANLNASDTILSHNESSKILHQQIHEENNLKEMLDPNTSMLILKILVYIVTPLISTFGISGNIISIIIIRRHGLNKCSNILLLCLAISDMCFLISFNNIPKALYDIDGRGRFIYSKDISYCLFILYYFLTVIDYGMAMVGLTIPALITSERFIAVYFPFALHQIVTPFRTWTIIVVIGLYSLAVSTVTTFWYRLDFHFDSELNDTVAQINTTDLFYEHEHGFGKYLHLFHFSVTIQPVFTFIGCVCIIAKVKYAAMKRLKMTENGVRGQNDGVSKTTKILMTVCIAYVIVSLIVAMPNYLPDAIISFSLSSQDGVTNLSLIMYQILNLALCVNSSWNFIIYMVLNKKFRESFREIKSSFRCFSCQRSTN